MGMNCGGQDGAGQGVGIKGRKQFGTTLVAINKIYIKKINSL